MTSTLLIADPDVELTQLLAAYLEPEGFILTVVHDGETAAKKALNQSFDAIILDIILPKKNGFIVVKTLREYKQTPVMFLTARKDDIDRIVGLEIGADDYLLKPCNPRELLARLRAILRRSQKTLPERGVIKKNDLSLDCAKRSVQVGELFLDLTNTEFNILEMLMKTPGQAFSKEELTEYALGRKFSAYDRSIDVHISNLRTKLGNNARNEPKIKTVRGFGYLFDD